MTMAMVSAFSLYLGCFTTLTEFLLLLGVDPDALDPDGGVGSSSVDPPLLHVSYQTAHELPLINSYTDPGYFTAAFPTLFPFGIGGHLGDVNGSRPETISLQTFAKYTMLHHSLLYVCHASSRMTLLSRYLISP
jgi:hypothetical protein